MTATGDVFILALDHRGSIERLYGFTPPTDAEQRRRIEFGKQLVLDALIEASQRLPDPTAAGVLLDEQYGARLVPRARAAGIGLAICAEQSGRTVFDFEYPDWQRRIDRMAPDFVKVLARHHPHGDAVGNVLQRERLRALGEFLSTIPDTRFLLEILVAPTSHDSAPSGAPHGRFVTDERVDLIVEAVEELQDGGVEPDLWKVEGLAEGADCRRVRDACRRGGRSDVGVVVLGAGAPAEVVETWLRAAATVGGYRGFAVGRSIWADELRAHLAGELDEDECRARVAANYLRFVDAYQQAAGTSSGR